MDWKKLQNGSDIRGVALEGVEGEAVNLTPQVVHILGKAFVQWLKKYGSGTSVSVAVGTDSRISGPKLKEAFMQGMRETGATVFDCGMASTPAMFMTTVHEKEPATAGVMITASHLPFNRNGLKFFTRNGGLNKADISEILGIAEGGVFEQCESCPEIKKWNFTNSYADFLVKYIRESSNLTTNFNEPLKGLKIIVDAGNGAGGFFATKVLNQLGADTSGSQYLEPDGTFPNHTPNPEDKNAMQSICNAVLKEKADLGVIFDTDVDRAAIVDSKGNPVNRNSLIALIAAVVLQEYPGSTVVTDSVTSEGLTRFIETELKGKHHRFQRGYKNVINEAIRLNDLGEESWLAIETSGHAALKENYFLDDGAYLVAKLLGEMAKRNAQGQNLTDLISNLQQAWESKEFRFGITTDNFKEYGEAVLKQLEDMVKLEEGWELVSPNFEGLRVRCANEDERGWFLLRMSLHDPVMPLNMESDVEGGVENISKRLFILLNEFHGLKFP